MAMWHCLSILFKAILVIKSRWLWARPGPLEVQHITHHRWQELHGVLLGQIQLVRLTGSQHQQQILLKTGNITNPSSLGSCFSQTFDYFSSDLPETKPSFLCLSCPLLHVLFNGVLTIGLAELFCSLQPTSLTNEVAPWAAKAHRGDHPPLALLVDVSPSHLHPSRGSDLLFTVHHGVCYWQKYKVVVTMLPWNGMGQPRLSLISISMSPNWYWQSW